MSFDLIIAIMSGLSGAVCGWMMSAFYGPQSSVTPGEPGVSTASEAVDGGAEDPSPERITMIADQLRSYAVTMTEDIDAHQSRVQAVSDTLVDGAQKDSPTAILDAVSELVKANEGMQQKLHLAQQQINDQSEQLETAEKRAVTDGLTRIANRRAFDTQFEICHAKGPAGAGVLAILDVDHFKKFNDVYGHRAGDEVLRVVARTFESQVSDYGMVARFGGEEFALLLDCPVDKAIEVIETARIAIGEKKIHFEGNDLQVKASAGVATLLPGESMEGWLQRADDGLYKSKDAGRDCAHRMDGEVPIRIELNGACKPASKPAAKIEVPAEPPAATPEPVAATTPFSKLPDREQIGAEFESMLEKAKAVGGLMQVLAIRYNAKPSNSAMRSLLQIVRAGSRSVEQLGTANETTLLLCMPNADEALAITRGEQIVKAIESVQQRNSDVNGKILGIGVSEARDGDVYEEVVNRVSEAAVSACGDGVKSVLVATPATV